MFKARVYRNYAQYGSNSMCTLRDKWRREHSATSSVHFVQVKLERIISGLQYVRSES